MTKSCLFIFLIVFLVFFEFLGFITNALHASVNQNIQKSDQNPAKIIGGCYEYFDSEKEISNYLEIEQVKEDEIKFYLSAIVGMYTGEVEGTATIDGNIAIHKNNEYEDCEIKFVFMNNTVLVDETHCGSLHGLGCFFDGEYLLKNNNGIKAFKGMIGGRFPITMYLEISGSSVRGSYFYDKYKKDISLNGAIEQDGKFVIKEQTTDGKITGSFLGNYEVAKGMSGRWSNSNGSKTLPFALDYLTLTDPEEAEKYIGYKYTNKDDPPNGWSKYENFKFLGSVESWCSVWTRGKQVMIWLLLQTDKVELDRNGWQVTDTVIFNKALTSWKVDCSPDNEICCFFKGNLVSDVVVLYDHNQETYGYKPIKAYRCNFSIGKFEEIPVKFLSLEDRIEGD